MTKLLEARLTIRYGGQIILNDLALEIAHGEIVGLAGQSGSGKSTLALALLRLSECRQASAEGSLRFEGRELQHAPESEWRKLRGRRISLVLQGAESALNPALRLERQLSLAWRIHEKAPWESQGLPWAREIFAQCGLPETDEFLRRYPSQISVGQSQRVLIAMALLHRPALVVADEITSALDPQTRRDVLATLQDVNRKFGTAVLFVSHDHAALRALSHRVAVLEGGTLVESEPAVSIA